MSEDCLNYDPAQQRGDSLSENWRDPNKPKLKNIKDEDVAYELRELSKYNSLTPEIINIICHGYARICQLERERDKAREQAELWEDDALRLMEERNKALKERDEARREICHYACGRELWSYKGTTPIEVAYHQGWNCFKEDGK